jgi:DNA-binding transcriptional MerR regulator
MATDAIRRKIMSGTRHPTRSASSNRIYSITQIAELARVTTEFIRACEREELIQAAAESGGMGYPHHTVRRLIRIRHLHTDLGLDLPAIDYYLRMRRQIGAMQERMRDMERRMQARESELVAEIQRLHRQLAREVEWRSRS